MELSACFYIFLNHNLDTLGIKGQFKIMEASDDFVRYEHSPAYSGKYYDVIIRRTSEKYYKVLTWVYEYRRKNVIYHNELGVRNYSDLAIIMCELINNH